MDAEPNSPREGWKGIVRENVGWWFLGLILLAVVVKMSNKFRAWIVLGIYFYYMARPISRRFERRMSSSSVGAAVTLLFIAIPLVLVITVVGIVAIARLKTHLPASLTPDALLALLEHLPVVGPDARKFVQTVSPERLLNTALGVVRSVANTGFQLLLTVLFALILLVHDRRIARWFQTTVLDENRSWSSYLVRVDRGIKSIYFGYTITIFVIIILSGILYYLLNFMAPAGVQIPSPVLLAVLTGLFSLFPGVGRPLFFLLITGYLTMLAMRTAPSNLWFPLVFLVLMLGIFGNVVRIYIRPKLSGRRVFPLPLVMFAYLLGPPIFGWYGIFLGPLVLAFLYPFLRLVLPGLLYPDRERTSDANSVSSGTGDEQL